MPDSGDVQDLSTNIVTSHNGMSVDVEDYYQVWGFSDVISRNSWDGFASRVGATTRRVLDLFENHGVTATFFTLGWVAEREPGLIREIVERGHELASHGYDHTKVFDQSPAEFREDVRKTKAILEDISGQPVTGFRAAGFSIDQRTPFAYDILVETGHQYSSSTHPIAHDHYGDPNAPQGPFKDQGSGLMELPVATTHVLGRRVSCAGGGWFRALPFGVNVQLLKKAMAEQRGPVIFYFHPWEIDPNQPRIQRASAKSRLRHYLNLKSMYGKLDRLLAQHSWGRIDQIVEAVNNDMSHLTLLQTTAKAGV